LLLFKICDFTSSSFCDAIQEGERNALPSFRTLAQNHIHRFGSAQAADLGLWRISQLNGLKLISQTLHRNFAF
jgi:hypothetical protein